MKVLWILVPVLGLLYGEVYAGFCTQSYTGTCIRPETYYTNCGLFGWGWAKCTRSRDVYYSCTLYRQVCCPGYKGVGCNIPVCYGSESCPNGGTCQTPDYCSCPKGFSSPRCDDLNECNTNNGGCSHDCNNNVGSYTCSCRTEYKLNTDGRTCSDLNECVQGTSGCAHWCKNTEGSYTCQCNTGYRLAIDGRTCEDIDECGDGTALCSGSCINNPGSYSCSCGSGYIIEDDGYTCKDNYMVIVVGVVGAVGVLAVLLLFVVCIRQMRLYRSNDKKANGVKRNNKYTVQDSDRF